MSRYLLSLDQGTTSGRAVLFDHRGRVVTIASRPLASRHPQSGHVEQDPVEMWRGIRESMDEALRQADATLADVAAIGVTNQRQTTVAWRRSTGEPVGPAMVWQSRASEPVCRRWREAGLADRVADVTGLPIDPCFTASKVVWMLEQNADLRQLADAGDLVFGTVDAYLASRLTGGRAVVTDSSNASGTMLYDLRENRWSGELLDAFGIDESWLPEIAPSSGVVGQTDGETFGREVPVGGMIGDQQSALFGQSCVDVGDAKVTYGTGAFFLMNSGDRVTPPDSGLIASVAWNLGQGNVYAVEGFIMAACSTFEWLCNELRLAESPPDLETLAAGADGTGGVTVVPAFSGLAAPSWNSDARAIVAGLSGGSTRAHIARAAFEALAHQVCDVLEVARSLPGGAIDELRVDGGGSNSELLLRLQADLADIPVVRPQVTETTARGAAYMAGLAAGVWSGVDELRDLWTADRRVEPTMSADDREAHRDQWQRAVRQCVAT